MSVELRRTKKRRVSDFRRLHESLDPTLVPEVRAAQFSALRVKRGRCTSRTLIVRVSEADKDDFVRKSQVPVFF